MLSSFRVTSAVVPPSALAVAVVAVVDRNNYKNYQREEKKV